ncbi:hypothetical protein L3Q82_005846 [Scortum barcoo]|uniref:Uncharacterized protein n=1 Tax=Scortum barcoo TaxID=214431 RepID=A0ACB8V6H8_9TELE|nr:hypothetical protein L3Q82_005846 [Scortum barcoo]
MEVTLIPATSQSASDYPRHQAHVMSGQEAEVKGQRVHIQLQHEASDVSSGRPRPGFQKHSKVALQSKSTGIEQPPQSAVKNGWARGWISNGHRAPLRLRRQQGGGGVLVWAGIIKDELVGPFRVEDGLRLNSQTYCQFLEDTFFTQWYRKKSASFKKTMIFMQDNAPSQASKYSTVWLASKGP